jgi:glycosyltransferase involved in cell wall biosynthesis
MENFGKLLLEGLATRGHKITVISSRHPSGITYEEKGNIQIYYLPNTEFGSVRKGWRKESQNKFSALNDTIRFDIICSQQPIFPPISKEVRSNTPIVTFIQGHEGWMMLSELNRFLNFKHHPTILIKSITSFLYYYLMWERPNFRLSDLIITPADEVTSSLQKWFFLKPNKIKTIYNGVDTNLFRPDPTAKQRLMERYPQLSGQKIVLFMSHVTPQKGLHLLLKVLPSLAPQKNNVSLLVVGGGDFLEGAKEMAFQLSINNRVTFTGMMDVESLPDYINAADIFVLPTLRKEGLPLSILEAMACKIPVITTNIGGNASVVKNGFNGLLIPPGDMTKLEESISLLLHDSGLSHQLADNGYHFVQQKFSAQKMLDDCESQMIKQVEMKRPSSKLT